MKLDQMIRLCWLSLAVSILLAPSVCAAEASENSDILVVTRFGTVELRNHDLEVSNTIQIPHLARSYHIRCVAVLPGEQEVLLGTGGDKSPVTLLDLQTWTTENLERLPFPDYRKPWGQYTPYSLVGLRGRRFFMGDESIGDADRGVTGRVFVDLSKEAVANVSPPLWPAGDVFRTPLPDLMVALGHGSVVAFDTAKGATAWSKKLSENGSVQVLYVDTQSDPAKGIVVWRDRKEENEGVAYTSEIDWQTASIETTRSAVPKAVRVLQSNPQLLRLSLILDRQPGGVLRLFPIVTPFLEKLVLQLEGSPVLELIPDEPGAMYVSPSGNRLFVVKHKTIEVARTESGPITKGASTVTVIDLSKGQKVGEINYDDVVVAICFP